MAEFKKLYQKEFLKFKVTPVKVLNAFSSVNNKPFDDINRRLGVTKSKLDVMKPDRFMNVMYLEDCYLHMKKLLKGKFNMQVSTNAAMKMHEMICQLDLLKNGMKIFCNAELPGAFLCTIHHYMTTHNLTYTAYASSYIGYDENPELFSDRYGIWMRHPDMWVMGKNYRFVKRDDKIDGDVTNIDCLKEYEQLLQVDLYTADAGIDVSSDYSAQEDITLFINYGQILCGLLCLANDGKLITKQYTYNNPFSRSTITMLAYVFKRFYIVKPLTSRPGNSEIYLYGDGFIKERFLPLKDKLLDALARKDPTPLFELCRDDELIEYTKHIHDEQQIAFINEMVYVHEHYEQIMAIKSRLFDFYNKKIDEWLALNPMIRTTNPL